MADSAAVAGAAEKASGGLPQFDIAQWPGQMVWVLVIFAVLYFLVSKVFVPRVSGAIDAREDKISGDIGEAFRARFERDSTQHPRMTCHTSITVSIARNSGEINSDLAGWSGIIPIHAPGRPRTGRRARSG